jgi:L-asparaginase / beta-aspartyl-peptidase
MLKRYGKVMAVIILFSMTGCTSGIKSPDSDQTSGERARFALAIHGGAGVITRDNLDPEKEAAYLEALNQALDIGRDILDSEGSSLDAVVSVVTFLEDSPLFNAGKGAVFNHEGKNEMDASLMEGNRLMAGAVGGVRIIKNPILAARAVMEKSPHVLLVGAGAEAFAVEQGLDMVDPSYFYTEQRWKALQQVLQTEPDTTRLGHSDLKHGTVGAVALDSRGNLAAATSTGGMTNKRYHRIGDSPIIGAGTYANNATCAVSCTGHGEYFIRYAVAHDVSAQIMYGKKSLQEAGDYIIHEILAKAGGTGGLISLDRNGEIHMPFNTEGMYRGYVRPDGRMVKIYKD